MSGNNASIEDIELYYDRTANCLSIPCSCRNGGVTGTRTDSMYTTAHRSTRTLCCVRVFVT